MRFCVNDARFNFKSLKTHSVAIQLFKHPAEVFPPAFNPLLFLC
ncbi:hypothetical protein J500_1873 [Acinetobacter sp. 479375]|nr:hypothetical protein J500_1873 [Acinetobacter sp. 479375]